VASLDRYLATRDAAWARYHDVTGAASLACQRGEIGAGQVVAIRASAYASLDATLTAARITAGYQQPAPAELSEARCWIADCEWADEINPGQLTDAQVIRGIARHYDGGWQGFLSDGMSAAADTL
jgi:hypothetical protein